MTRNSWCRSCLAVLLCLLLASPGFSAAPPAPSNAVKEEVLLIQTGSAVEIRLIDNKKLRGRLGVVSDAGFELQILSGDTIVNRQITFDQVKSVRNKGKESFGHSLGKGFVIAGIVVGVLVVIGFVAAAINGNS